MRLIALLALSALPLLSLAQVRYTASYDIGPKYGYNDPADSGYATVTVPDFITETSYFYSDRGPRVTGSTNAGGTASQLYFGVFDAGVYVDALVGPTTSGLTGFSFTVPRSALGQYGTTTIRGFQGEFTLKVEAVPEPATMAALGLCAVAVLRRRKRA